MNHEEIDSKRLALFGLLCLLGFTVFEADYVAPERDQVARRLRRRNASRLMLAITGCALRFHRPVGARDNPPSTQK